MVELYETAPFLEYVDSNAKMTQEEMQEKINTSSTLYVGNLHPATTDRQLHALFGQCGRVSRIIMGINHKKEPCGFCFVEFETRDEARHAMQTLNRMQVRDRAMRTDWDSGYVEGREFGRGKNGMQKSAEKRFNDRDRDYPPRERYHRTYDDDDFPPRSRR